MSIAQRLAAVRRRIAQLETQYARESGSVRLIAVSKTKPIEDVLGAFAAGQHDFGENQLQDALTKVKATANLDTLWHFIGPVQSNKTRPIAEKFAWVHSLDRVKIAERLSDQRPAELEPLNVLVQVNISHEPTKAGVRVSQCGALEDLVQAVDGLPGLRLRGLMTIPSPQPTLSAQRRPLAELAALLADLNRRPGRTTPLDTLSMGMTDDLEAAIAEGATMVRIGTAIFGPRARPG